jgi:hypothetical protein
MARVITYIVIAGLGLFVLATTFLISKGGGSANPADGTQTVSIHDLSINPEAHRGNTVITEGDLVFSPDIKEYQVVDQGIAIVVVGYEEEAFRSLDGRRVKVTGRFDFDLGTGIFIDADIVTVVE